eukprot:PhM_4_TR15805/c0_g1_i1/m.2924
MSSKQKVYIPTISPEDVVPDARWLCDLCGTDNPPQCLACEICTAPFSSSDDGHRAFAKMQKQLIKQEQQRQREAEEVLERQRKQHTADAEYELAMMVAAAAAEAKKEQEEADRM